MQAIDLEDQPALILVFDPEVPLLPLERPGRVILALPERDTAFETPAGVSVERVRLRDLRGVRTPPALRGVRLGSVVVHPIVGVRLRVLFGALRLRPERVFMVDSLVSRVEYNARGSVAVSAGLRVVQQVERLPLLRGGLARAGVRLSPRFPTPTRSARVTGEIVARANETTPAIPEGPLTITHYIGSLGPGGAERQLVYLVRGSIARGHRVRIRTAYPLQGANAHYLAHVRAAGADVRDLTPTSRFGGLPWSLRRRLGLPHALADDLEVHDMAGLMLPLLAALEGERPDVLHCWMDSTNVAGAVAGLALGIPRVLVSTRSLSPAHYPWLIEPWQARTYRALADARRVVFLANSRAGAADYAAWCGFAPERLRVIGNGIPTDELLPLAADEDRAALRRAHGLDPEGFLVGCVFRLQPEKRPLEALEALALARTEVPELRAVFLGDGDLRAASEEAAARLDLADAVQFRGLVRDPHTLVRLCDATLLMCPTEGCPNVSLESQALGVPVVVPDGAGAPETIERGRTGLEYASLDTADAATQLVALAQDPGRRQAMGGAAREWIQRAFGIERMVEETLAAYR